MRIRTYVPVCLCVCARARARASVCVCLCVRVCFEGCVIRAPPQVFELEALGGTHNSFRALSTAGFAAADEGFGFARHGALHNVYNRYIYIYTGNGIITYNLYHIYIIKPAAGEGFARHWLRCDRNLHNPSILSYPLIHIAQVRSHRSVRALRGPLIPVVIFRNRSLSPSLPHYAPSVALSLYISPPPSARGSAPHPLRAAPAPPRGPLPPGNLKIADWCMFHRMFSMM